MKYLTALHFHTFTGLEAITITFAIIALGFAIGYYTCSITRRSRSVSHLRAENAMLKRKLNLALRRTINLEGDTEEMRLKRYFRPS